MCVFIIKCFGQILAHSVTQNRRVDRHQGVAKSATPVCLIVCVQTHQMDHKTVDVEKYDGCKCVCVCVYLNRSTDVQRSDSVKAVYLIVKDTFNYNSRGSSLCVYLCV